MIELWLACYGVTFTLCDAKLTTRPRQWLQRSSFVASLLGCYFCTGFWVSMGLSWLDGYQGVDWLLMGFGGAAATYIINSVVMALERWTYG